MNESLHLRCLTAPDLAFAHGLSLKAGWNQTPNDWHRLLAHEPEGCFLAEWNGIPVGTATTTRYGTEVAWIGMMLVDSEFRRHGIGKALMTRCLDYLQGCQVQSIKLDATPLGKTLYDRLGFVSEWTLCRWEHSRFNSATVMPFDSVRAWKPADETKLRVFDHAAFGCDRFKMLGALVQTGQPTLVRTVDQRLTGFGCLRRGERATYLGPVVADSTEAARELIETLLVSPPSPAIFWDIPDQNLAAIQLAKELGFRQQRQLIRMYLGANPSPGQPLHQFAIAAPEIG